MYFVSQLGKNANSVYDQFLLFHLFFVIAENQYPNNKKVLTFDVEEEQLQTYYCGAREHICMSHLPQMQPPNAQQVGPPDGCLTSRTPRDR